MERGLAFKISRFMSKPIITDSARSAMPPSAVVIGLLRR